MISRPDSRGNKPSHLYSNVPQRICVYVLEFQILISSSCCISEKTKTHKDQISLKINMHPINSYRFLFYFFKKAKTLLLLSSLSAPTSASPLTTARWRARWTMSSTQAVPLQLAAALSPAVGPTMWTQVVPPPPPSHPFCTHFRRLSGSWAEVHINSDTKIFLKNQKNC